MTEPRDTMRRAASPFVILSMFVITVLFAPQFSGLDVGLFDCFSLALCGASAAWLFASTKWWVGGLTAIPIALLSFYLSDGSPLVILCSLLYLPFGIGFSLVKKGSLTRGTAVGIGAFLSTAVIMASLLIPIYADQGSLSLSAIQAQYPEALDLLRALLKDSFTISIAGKEVSYISDANIHEYVNLVIAMIPGLLGAVMAFVGFLCGFIFKVFLRLNPSGELEPDLWRLKPSPVTGIVFLLAVAALFFAGSAYAVWIAAICVVLALTPTLGLAGFTSVFEVRLVDGLPRRRILRGVVLFVGLLSGLFGTILVALFYGLYDCLIPSLFGALKRLPKPPKE